MLSEKNKTLLIKTGILFGAFVVVSAVLVSMIFLSKGFKVSALKENVEQTLENYKSGEYKVGNYVELKSQLSTEAVIFECSKAKKNSTRLYAVILRISTLAGSAPAVFVCSEYECTFAGFAIENGKVNRLLNPGFKEIHIDYWQNSLSGILLNAGLFND